MSILQSKNSQVQALWSKRLLSLLESANCCSWDLDQLHFILLRSCVLLTDRLVSYSLSSISVTLAASKVLRSEQAWPSSQPQVTLGNFHFCVCVWTTDSRWVYVDTISKAVWLCSKAFYMRKKNVWEGVCRCTLFSPWYWPPELSFSWVSLVVVEMVRLKENECIHFLFSH